MIPGKKSPHLCWRFKIRYGKSIGFVPEERQAFHDMGGHGRKGCPEVCGVAAKMAAEVILDIKEEPA
jgi:hypothetical protein